MRRFKEITPSEPLEFLYKGKMYFVGGTIIDYRWKWEYKNIDIRTEDDIEIDQKSIRNEALVRAAQLALEIYCDLDSTNLTIEDDEEIRAQIRDEAI